MARYQSIGGKWFPVKEHHIYSQKEMEAMGKDPIKDSPVYSGPCRAAMAELEKEGVEFFGKDCRMQEETMIKARQLGCQSVTEYLEKYRGINLDKLEKDQKKALDEITHLDEPKVIKKRPVNPPSGGDDSTGGKKGRKGGFGDPDDVSIPGLKTGPGKSAVK